MTSSSRNHEVRDLEYVPNAVPRTQVTGAVERVRALTDRPLTFVGAGMTALVFCNDRGRAYKAARRPGHSSALEDEAEWLATANQVHGLRARVARLVSWESDLDVIVRSCPMPVEDAHRRRRKLYDLWREIGARMAPYGWTAPEFKEDSFVIARSGPVLVDAGFVQRTGRRMLAYVQDILIGKRKKPANERWSDLAYYLRREVTEKTLPPHLVTPTIRRLGERDPEALQWL